MNWRGRFAQSGFSMIEVAVATAVLSMGLGSLSLMMLAAINGTSQARHQTVAATQAASLAEMIALSSDAYGHYLTPPGADVASCESEFCDGAAMAAANHSFWQAQITHALPNGAGFVCRDGSPDDGTPEDPACDGAGAVVIKIFWSDSIGDPAQDAGFRRLVLRLPW